MSEPTSRFNSPSRVAKSGDAAASTRAEDSIPGSRISIECGPRGARVTSRTSPAKQAAAPSEQLHVFLSKRNDAIVLTLAGDIFLQAIKGGTGQNSPKPKTPKQTKVIVRSARGEEIVVEVVKNGTETSMQLHLPAGFDQNRVILHTEDSSLSGILPQASNSQPSAKAPCAKAKSHRIAKPTYPFSPN